MLNLTFHTDYSRLKELLVNVPNLLWLKMEIFNVEISIDQIPKLDNLRVLSIDQTFSTDDTEQLKQKLPNIDVLEV